jgi:hypothetical protein
MVNGSRPTSHGRGADRNRFELVQWVSLALVEAPHIASSFSRRIPDAVNQQRSRPATDTQECERSSAVMSTYAVCKERKSESRLGLGRGTREEMPEWPRRRNGSRLRLKKEIMLPTHRTGVENRRNCRSNSDFQLGFQEKRESGSERGGILRIREKFRRRER